MLELLSNPQIIHECFPLSAQSNAEVHAARCDQRLCPRMLLRPFTCVKLFVSSLALASQWQQRDRKFVWLSNPPNADNQEGNPNHWQPGDAVGKCVERSHVDNWKHLQLDISNAYKHRRKCLQLCESGNFVMAAVVWGLECSCGNQESAER